MDDLYIGLNNITCMTLNEFMNLSWRRVLHYRKRYIEWYEENKKS
jgi:hypothetical protein